MQLKVNLGKHINVTEDKTILNNWHILKPSKKLTSKEPDLSHNDDTSSMDILDLVDQTVYNP